MDHELSKQTCRTPYTKPIYENVVCFDVDDTLILWGRAGEPDIYMLCPYYGTIEGGKFHKEHIERVKRHKADGHFVIIWSGGGAKHAKAAVEALGLADYVDLIMDKPFQFYDDVTADRFMGTRSWVGDNKAHQTYIGGWDDKVIDIKKLDPKED